VDLGALPHRAENPRSRFRVHRVDWGRWIADAVLTDLEGPGLACDIEHERFRTIEPQDVQALERDRGAQRHGEARHDVAKAARLGDETRDGREDVHWVGLAHGS